MQPSSQPLGHIPDMPPQQELQSRMPPLGSTSSGGRSTTLPLRQQKSLEEVLASIQARFVPRQELTIVTPPSAPMTTAKQSKPPVAPPERKPPLLRDSPEAQDQLTDLLCQCYASQTPYGDKAQMMALRDQMFQLVLADCTIEEIRKAFIMHIARSPNLPTPHDIVALIDPTMQPLSQAMYIKLTKKQIPGNPYSLTESEKRYIERFEANELRKIV